MSQGAFEFAAQDDPAELADPTYSVSGLNAAIADALRSRFESEVWVRGEIKGYRRTNPGHVYFTLVEEVDGTEQSVQVTLFNRTRIAVEQFLDRHRMRLADGISVRLCGRVEYYAPQGKVSLKMSGIDPTYTLGQMAADRDALVARLAAAGLIGANARLELPLVPLRVALVTSRGSAAYHDTVDELRRSPYRWSLMEFDTRVQGADAPDSIARALAAAGAQSPDVVVLVRGGGSRTDLAAFDHETVALAVARCAVPVVVGVGHEIDSSVADLVAHTALKTPTACAQFLVDKVRAFDLRLEQNSARVIGAARLRLEAATRRVDDRSGRLVRDVSAALRAAEASAVALGARTVTGARAQQHRAVQDLDYLAARLARRGSVIPVELDRAVEALAAHVSAHDPARLLARGWTITRTIDGVLVREPDDAPPGTRMVTTTAAGPLFSTVEES